MPLQLNCYLLMDLQIIWQFNNHNAIENNINCYMNCVTEFDIETKKYHRIPLDSNTCAIIF